MHKIKKYLLKYAQNGKMKQKTYKNNGLKFLSLITISTELSTVLHNFDYIFQYIDIFLRTNEKAAQKGGVIIWRKQVMQTRMAIAGCSQGRF